MLLQKRMSTGFLLIASLLIFLSCSFFGEENKSILKIEYYSFDSSSILDNLNSSTPSYEKLFSLTTEPSYTSNEEIVSSLSWQQEDFTKILEAFFLWKFQDDIQAWHYSRINLTTSCSDVEKGFQYGQFELFSESSANNTENQRLVRFFEIDLGRKIILVTEAQYTPVLFSWSFIPFASFKVKDGESALLIAEQNGGETGRRKLSNKCEITVMISPDFRRRTPTWSIDYGEPQKPTPFLEFEIDPITGLPQ